jgi:hypothetical protein
MNVSGPVVNVDNFYLTMQHLGWNTHKAHILSWMNVTSAEAFGGSR